MTKRSLLLTLFVALTLPCIEVPDWLTRCDDPSNDFVVMTSKPKAVSLDLIQGDPPPQLQRGRPPNRFLLPHSTFTSELPFVTEQELVIFVSLQKK